MFVNVTLANGSNLRQVASNLAANGLKISNQLSEIGVISGEVNPDNIPALKAITGVISVDEDVEMHAISHK